MVSLVGHTKNKKDYCENIDSRLGFKCTTTIIDADWQLEADPYRW